MAGVSVSSDGQNNLTLLESPNYRHYTDCGTQQYGFPSL